MISSLFHTIVILSKITDIISVLVYGLLYLTCTTVDNKEVKKVQYFQRFDNTFGCDLWVGAKRTSVRAGRVGTLRVIVESCVRLWKYLPINLISN